MFSAHTERAAFGLQAALRRHCSYHRRVRGRTPAGHGPLQPARVILLLVYFLRFITSGNIIRVEPWASCSSRAHWCGMGIFVFSRFEKGWKKGAKHDTSDIERAIKGSSRRASLLPRWRKASARGFIRRPAPPRWTARPCDLRTPLEKDCDAGDYDLRFA